MSSLSLSQALSRCLGKPEQMKPLLTVAFSMQFMESSSSLLLPPCPSPPHGFPHACQSLGHYSAITNHCVCAEYPKGTGSAYLSSFPFPNRWRIHSCRSVLIFPSSTLGLRLSQRGGCSLPTFFFLSFQEGRKFHRKKHVFSKTEFTSEWDALKLGSPYFWVQSVVGDGYVRLAWLRASGEL